MPLLIGTISLIAILINYNLKLNSNLYLANEKIDHLQKRNFDLSKSTDTFQSFATTFASLAVQSISLNQKTTDSCQEAINTMKKKLTDLSA